MAFKPLHYGRIASAFLMHTHRRHVKGKRLEYAVGQIECAIGMRLEQIFVIAFPAAVGANHFYVVLQLRAVVHVVKTAGAGYAKHAFHLYPDNIVAFHVLRLFRRGYHINDTADNVLAVELLEKAFVQTEAFAAVLIG